MESSRWPHFAGKIKFVVISTWFISQCRWQTKCNLCKWKTRCIIRFGHDLRDYVLNLRHFRSGGWDAQGRILDSGKVSLQMSTAAKPKSFDMKKFELNTGSLTLPCF
ncbi:MAG: hypothetical protein IPP49_14980 [Saprospiraceae bacterium]|nr:hypothetical protein [Saprospiraceae bacterium]